MAINWDLLLLLLLGLILLAIMLRQKKKVEVQRIAFPLIYFILYRTKLGLNLMDKFAKRYPKFLKVLGRVGVFVGFSGMIAGFFYFLYIVAKFIIKGTPTGVGLLIPGIKVVEGLPKLGFFHWIIAIFVLAAVHEFSHGLLSRLHNIKLKSSGFAVLGILLPIVPAAFVEPDEKVMGKKGKREQLEVLAAGSFANFITGGVMLIFFLLLIQPFSNSLMDKSVLVIDRTDNGSAAEEAGILAGDQLIAMNDVLVSDEEKFIEVIEAIKPGDRVVLKTNTSSYEVIAGEHPENKDDGYLGLNFRGKLKEEAFEKYGEGGIRAISWISLLFFWLVMTNFGVGLVNLLPLGPIDGGRMFYLAALHFLKDEKKAKKLWISVSVIVLILILIAISSQITGFISFLFNGVIALIS